MDELDVKRHGAMSMIDARANTVHQKHTTAGMLFQAHVYAEKVEEATDLMASGDFDNLKNYPLIGAETEATGQNVETIVVNILKKRADWILLMAQIEKIRLGAKTKIRKADTPAEIEDLLNSALAELDIL